MLYLLVGLPGSGKSTWAKEKADKELNTIIINRDSLRTMIKYDYTFEKETEPLIKLFRSALIKIALDEKFDVIIDETHLTIDMRTKIIEAVKKSFPDTDITCVYCPEDKRNIAMRMKDPRGFATTYWADVIYKMKQVFEPPTIQEGYNEMILYEIPETSKFE